MGLLLTIVSCNLADGVATDAYSSFARCRRVASHPPPGLIEVPYSVASSFEKAIGHKQCVSRTGPLSYSYHYRQCQRC